MKGKNHSLKQQQKKFPSKEPQKQTHVLTAKTMDMLNINIMPASALQTLFDNSGSLAKNSEFQAHYWALNIMFDNNETLKNVIINVPITMFNYQQEVSGAHIDFDLVDVLKVSDDTKSIAEAQAGSFIHTNENTIKQIIQKVFKTDATEIKYELSPLNSIHRHPGGSSQSFSSTDLQTKIGDTIGIVYPIMSAEEPTINMASIMYIDGNKCRLAHSECRIVHGNADKKNLKYTRVPTIYIQQMDIKQEINKTQQWFFGNNIKQEEHKMELSFNGFEINGITDEALDFCQELCIQIKINTTVLAIPDNVTKKKYEYKTYEKNGLFGNSYDTNWHEGKEYSYMNQTTKEPTNTQHKTKGYNTRIAKVCSCLGKNGTTLEEYEMDVLEEYNTVFELADDAVMRFEGMSRHMKESAEKTAKELLLKHGFYDKEDILLMKDNELISEAVEAFIMHPMFFTALTLDSVFD